MTEFLKFVFSDLKMAIVFSVGMLIATEIICNCISVCVLYITESNARYKKYVETATRQLEDMQNKNTKKSEILSKISPSSK